MAVKFREEIWSFKWSSFVPKLELVSEEVSVISVFDASGIRQRFYSMILFFLPTWWPTNAQEYKYTFMQCYISVRECLVCKVKNRNEVAANCPLFSSEIISRRSPSKNGIQKGSSAWQSKEDKQRQTKKEEFLRKLHPTDCRTSSLSNMAWGTISKYTVLWKTLYMKRGRYSHLGFSIGKLQGEITAW